MVFKYFPVVSNIKPENCAENKMYLNNNVVWKLKEKNQSYEVHCY